MDRRRCHHRRCPNRSQRHCPNWCLRHLRYLRPQQMHHRIGVHSFRIHWNYHNFYFSIDSLSICWIFVRYCFHCHRRCYMLSPSFHRSYRRSFHLNALLLFSIVFVWRHRHRHTVQNAAALIQYAVIVRERCAIVVFPFPARMHYNSYRQLYHCLMTAGPSLSAATSTLKYLEKETNKMNIAERLSVVRVDRCWVFGCVCVRTFNLEWRHNDKCDRVRVLQVCRRCHNTPSSQASIDKANGDRYTYDIQTHIRPVRHRCESSKNRRKKNKRHHCHCRICCVPLLRYNRHRNVFMFITICCLAQSQVALIQIDERVRGAIVLVSHLHFGKKEE